MWESVGKDIDDSSLSSEDIEPWMLLNPGSLKLFHLGLHLNSYKDDEPKICTLQRDG